MSKTFLNIFILLILLVLYQGCRKDQLPYSLAVPMGFPYPKIPEDNQLTTARIELGKQLFFDPILSRDSSISCASCHFQQYAFADNKVISPGIEGRLGFRNAPSLANAAYRERLFYDGGVPSLELQVVAPIEDHNEMDFNLLAAVERLIQHEDYPRLIKKAYGTEPTIYALTRAIAAYERTLLSGNSAFDKYYYRGDSNALTAEEKRGKDLFFSARTKCSSCHSGFNFSNEEFINIGLYADFSDDTGRKRVTALEADEGKFKVPSLRNVALTAPYMHDGSMPTLADVIDFFDSGGHPHPNKSPLIQPLGLSATEKTELIAFLNSLTDWDFVNN